MFGDDVRADTSTTLLSDTCRHIEIIGDSQLAYNKGKGKAVQWLRDHIQHEANECLKWPFYIHPNGYGQFGYLGHIHYAHRFMCALVHGSPPTQKHEAAHSCGRGHEGCVNPQHLSWKTQSENLLDCTLHGSHPRNTYGNRGRLTPEQVIQIRQLKGEKTQAEIAAIFGIREPSVRDIFLGRTYAHIGQ